MTFSSHRIIAYINPYDLKRQVVKLFLEERKCELVRLESLGRHGSRVSFRHDNRYHIVDVTVSSTLTDDAEVCGALAFKLIAAIDAELS